jgi:glutathione S-transferase
MNLIVYGVPLSPYVRKVCLCLAAKQLDYQLEIVLPFNQPPWFLALNPLGRIPALKDGDLTLADSSVICQYLEEKYTDHMSLLGLNAEQHAKVRWLEKYADYELAPLTTFTVFQQRIINPSMQKSCDDQLVNLAVNEQLPPHFDYLEQTLGSNEYFVANTLSLADLAFASQMVNMQHSGEQLNAQRWPNLAALFERVKALPAMQTLLQNEQVMLASMQ